MRKIFSLIIYTLSAIPVFFLVIFSVRALELQGKSLTIWRTGDVGLFLLSIFWGVVIFGSISYFLLRFMTTKHPMAIDHIYHCGLLYFFFTLFFVDYVRYSVYTSGALQSTLQAVILIILFIGITVNAIILHSKTNDK